MPSKSPKSPKSPKSHTQPTHRRTGAMCFDPTVAEIDAAEIDAAEIDAAVQAVSYALSKLVVSTTNYFNKSR